MKAITLHQPWASWVARGWKTIETRTHNRFASLKGQRIAIHASKHYDLNAFEAAAHYMTPSQIDLHVAQSVFIHGAIVCTAFVHRVAICNQLDCNNALIECNTTRFGLYLNDIRRVEPIPCKGHQGIWQYPVDIDAFLRA